MDPASQHVRSLHRQQALVHQKRDDPRPEHLLQRLEGDIGSRGGGIEQARAHEQAVGDQGVQVGVKVQVLAEGVDGHDDAGQTLGQAERGMQVFEQALHGNWYTLALNTAKARVETFALSRFRQIAATGQTFTRPAEFCPETYARQAFGIAGGEEPIKVRLLFEPKLAVYITEPRSIQRYLEGVGLPSRAPPIAPARVPILNTSSITQLPKPPG